MNPEIKQLKPFIYHAKEVESSNPMFAYYLKSYAIQKAHKIFLAQMQKQIRDQELENSIKAWLKEAEDIKRKYPQMFVDKKQNEQEITDFVIKLFFKCDNEERENNFDKNTVQNFQVCSRYMEMLGFFGPLSQELNQKRIYSKSKALECMKCLKDPQLMQQRMQKAQNLKSQSQVNAEDIEIENQMKQILNKQQQNDKSLDNKSQMQNNTQNYQQQQTQQQQNIFKENKQETIQNNVDLSSIQNKQQAQVECVRYLTFAASELDFKNYETAQDNLESVLKILEKFK